MGAMNYSRAMPVNGAPSINVQRPGVVILRKSIRTSGLSLIYYHPRGTETARTCAAIWEESNQVRLVSPFLRKCDGIVDPQPFIKKFPCAGAAVEPFERAMEWLDSTCYAATESAQVQLACNAEWEWGLRCVPYDASDRTLGLGGLGKPLVSDKALLKEVARQCLLQTVKRLLKEDIVFVGGQLEILEPDGATGDVATVYFPHAHVLRICLLKKINSTDVIRRGILAMDRMGTSDSTWQHTLLVMPGLEIERPMFLTGSVTICSLEFSLIHAALTSLVGKPA